MNLELTDAETAVVDEAARVIGRVAGLDRRRHAPAGGLWRALADAGWTGLGGAMEGGALAIGPAIGIFREAGRHLLTEQFVTGAYLLSALAAHCAADRADMEARLLRRPGVLLGDGRRPGLASADPATDPAADPAADPGAPGTAGFCFGIEEPPDVYRVVRAPGGEADLALAVLEGGAVETHPIAGLSAAVGRVTVTVGSWRRAALDLDRAGLDRIERTAMLLHSAALLGGALAALETTRDYVSQRVQFGVPVGSFQAVKHALADVHAGNEVASSAVLVAAASDVDPYRTLVARLLAVEAALAAARAAAQFHGGIGFTSEADVHLYLKAALDGATRFAGPDEVAAEIGRMFTQARVDAPC